MVAINQSNWHAFDLFLHITLHAHVIHILCLPPHTLTYLPTTFFFLVKGQAFTTNSRIDIPNSFRKPAFIPIKLAWVGGWLAGCS